MRLIDELTNHPLFDERPINEVFEPLGFEVYMDQQESPGPDEDTDGYDRFNDDPDAYMDGLDFSVPAGFTELVRFETEDCEIVMLAVKPTNQLSRMLMEKADDPGSA